jgi:hypothetical protein
MERSKVDLLAPFALSEEPPPSIIFDQHSAGAGSSYPQMGGVESATGGKGITSR